MKNFSCKLNKELSFLNFSGRQLKMNDFSKKTLNNKYFSINSQLFLFNRSKITIFAQNSYTMRTIKTLKILRELKKDGWVMVHQVGSHRQFKHPTKKGEVTVNGSESDDVWGPKLKSIEQQSGLKF